MIKAPAKSPFVITTELRTGVGLSSPPPMVLLTSILLSLRGSVPPERNRSG